MKESTAGMIDPFDSVTIAGMCLNTFRTCLLHEEWSVELAEQKDLPFSLRNNDTEVQYDDQWWTLATLRR